MPYPTYGLSISNTQSPLPSPRSVDSLDKKHLIFETIDDPGWNPGFRARFPWIGFGALFTVLLCSAASCMILYSANGRSQTHWPEQIAPNVLLNIMNNIANICFGVAIGNGIAIAWWRKTLKGSSIVELHRSWAFSTSIKDVVFKVKYFNVVALAALTAKLTLIDGTLMQKALTFYNAVDSTPIDITGIRGFAGKTWYDTGAVDADGQAETMTNQLVDTLRMWTQTGGSYPIEWDGCHKGFCYIEVPTLGFAFDCDEQIQTNIDYGSLLEETPRNSTNSEPLPLFEISFDSVIFDPSIDSKANTNYNPPAIPSRSGSGYVRSSGKTSHMKMHVMFTQVGTEYNPTGSDNHCPGTKFEQTCRLWPAIVKYPVQIQSIPGARTVSVGSRKPSLEDHVTSDQSDPDLAAYNITYMQQNGFEVMSYLSVSDYYLKESKSKISDFGGIQMAFEIALQGKAHLSMADNRNNGFSIHQHGQAGIYLPEPPMRTSGCSYYYTNPMDHYVAPNYLFSVPSVVAKINQIMFGVGTDISQDGYSLDTPRKDYPTFNGKRYPYQVHYRTNFDYMWGAVSATIVCVLLVLPVYWGFWELGRKVSLNPFEIAHAFRSPVVGYASTAVTEDLIKEVGHQNIRYGPVLSGDGFGRFGVAAPEYVARVPTGGSTFRPSSSRRGFWVD